MLLRTVRMRGVRIDPAARIARAEAGALWQDVTVPAGEHGLAALAGSSPNVGVTGYTLGGGLGWLARRYGLAANSVTAAEVVTPDGRHAARRRRSRAGSACWQPARTKARSVAVMLTTTGRSPSRPIRPCAAPSMASAWSSWRPRQATWPPRWAGT